MSPTPRIGRPKDNPTIDLSPDEIAARQAAGIALDVDLTPEEIRAREAEKQQILASIPVAPKPALSALIATAEKKSGVADVLAGIQGDAQDAVRARDETLRAQAKAVIDPLVTRSTAAQTRLGISRKKHLTEVEQIANVNLREVLRRLPLQSEYGATTVVTNHDRVTFLVRHAQGLAAALASAFPDANEAVQYFSTFEHNIYYIPGDAQGYWDVVDQRPSVTFKQARAHAEHWVKKIEGHVAGVEDGLARFATLRDRVAADLAALGTLEQVPAEPVPGMVGALPDAPLRRDTTSFQEFDPREHPSTWGGKKDTSGVVRRNDGKGAGVPSQVESGFGRDGHGKKGHVVGTTDGVVA